MVQDKKSNFAHLLMFFGAIFSLFVQVLIFLPQFSGGSTLSK